MTHITGLETGHTCAFPSFYLSIYLSIYLSLSLPLTTHHKGTVSSTATIPPLPLSTHASQPTNQKHVQEFQIQYGIHSPADGCPLPNSCHRCRHALGHSCGLPAQDMSTKTETSMMMQKSSAICTNRANSNTPTRPQTPSSSQRYIFSH